MRFLNKLRISQRHILGINDRNCSYVYQHNPRKYFHLANDKAACKVLLKEANILTPKTYFILKGIGEIELLWSQLNELPNMVIKPANGSGGNGILVLKKENGKWIKGTEVVEPSKIKKHIANILFGVFSFGADDAAIVEELIISHPFLAELYPKGVADIRIITFQEKIVMGMLRLPTESSNGKANIHQGGLGVGIDLESGRLTNVYDGKNDHECHPDNGIAITGKVLPYWKEMYHLAVECSKNIELKYLGVDLVIDRDKGPMVIELNARPGLEIQNVNRKGLNEAIKELCK